MNILSKSVSEVFNPIVKKICRKYPAKFSRLSYKKPNLKPTKNKFRMFIRGTSTWNNYHYSNSNVKSKFIDSNGEVEFP